MTAKRLSKRMEALNNLAHYSLNLSTKIPARIGISQTN